MVYNKYENGTNQSIRPNSTRKKTKLLTNRDKRPWFDQDIVYQKRILRRCEKIWLRYRTETCWQAYQQTRGHYQSKIVEKKKEIISKKIEECGSE